MSIGFACAWGPDRRTTWSGTPWQLREALRHRTDLVDIDAQLPRPIARALRLAYVRRDGHGWRSLWQHGRPAKGLVSRRLRTSVARSGVSAAVEIHDLGIVDVPYFLLQDLSYDLLLDHFGERGVPHFRNLGQAQIRRLRDRQLGVYQSAAGLLPMSRWLAERMIAGGVAADRVHVVNPGVNVPLDPTAPIPMRRQGDVSKLLFLGRDFETKAGDQVVAAFELLRAELGPAITLTIAGPKVWPLRTAPPEGVNYLGPVPIGEVQRLYDSHDLFVMPSRFEGFGIAFVEALVRGLPCIGRDACAMPEIIDQHSGGRLVSREDPAELAATIMQALGDDALYRACAEAVPDRRAHYTWGRAADQVIAAIGSTG